MDKYVIVIYPISKEVLDSLPEDEVIDTSLVSFLAENKEMAGFWGNAIASNLNAPYHQVRTWEGTEVEGALGHVIH